MHVTKSIAALLLLSGASLVGAQTVITPNPSVTVQANTQRAGLNMGTPTTYDAGLMYKNLMLPGNAGGEGTFFQQIWQIQQGAAPLTATSFNSNINNVQFDAIPANALVGATMTVIQSCGANTLNCTGGGAELGCVATITSNTVSSHTAPLGATYTFAPACAAPIAVGDLITLSMSYLPTEAQLLTNGFGISPTETGSAHVTLETTDLCATCGASAYKLDTSAGGTITLQGARDNYDVDGIWPDQFRNLNGRTMVFTFWAKCASGTCSISPAAAGNGMSSCSPGAVSVTGTAWAKYTKSCVVTQTTATTGGLFMNFVAATGGVTYIDNLDFEQDPATTDPTNTTIFDDQYVNALKQQMGTGLPGNAATFRYNPATVLTLDDWILPTYSQVMTNEGYNQLSNYTTANYRTSLVDYLNLCILLQADPYIIVPATFSVTDWQNLSDFLDGGAGTTYGAKRIALGGPSGGYHTVFNAKHLTLGNENWNAGFLAFAIGFRNQTGGFSPYQDYESRAATVFSAMRAMPSYLDAHTTKGGNYLVLGAQSAGNGGNMTDLALVGKPDEIEIEQYTGGLLNDFTTPTAEFQPMFSEIFANMTSASSAHGVNGNLTAIKALSTCGGTGTLPCIMTIYEEGNGTVGGTATQTVVDGFAAGGAVGVGTFDQMLMTQQLGGVRTQNVYSATGYYQNTQNGGYTKIWGTNIDYGGASSVTNATFFGNGGNVSPRPIGLGYQLANQAIIGKMISCGMTGVPTYSMTVASNSVNPISNVPTIRAYCFQDATNPNHYRMALTNASLTTSLPITFSGSFAPTTAVGIQQLAPTNPTDSNEASGNAHTNTTAATVRITSLANQNLSSGITLPANSGTVLDFTTGTAPTVGGSSITGPVTVSGGTVIQ